MSMQRALQQHEAHSRNDVQLLAGHAVARRRDLEPARKRRNLAAAETAAAAHGRVSGPTVEAQWAEHGGGGDAAGSRSTRGSGAPHRA